MVSIVVSMLLLPFALGAHLTGMPSFKIHGYSRTSVPEMSVTFENGMSDNLLLEPYSQSPCNFIGKLKSHPSTTAVTGCMNKPGDKMHITLLSDLNTKSAMYELDFNGRVTALENPFKYQKESSVVLPRKINGLLHEFTKHKDKMGDELVNPVWEKSELNIMGKTHKAARFPESVYAYVKFGYENTMKAQMDRIGTTFAAFIDSVMTHVQSYYKHHTFPTQILFKYDNAETFFENVNWPSTDHLDDAQRAGERDNDPRVNLYAFWGSEGGAGGAVGVAALGGVCVPGARTSFNEWFHTPVQSAYVLAHEMGHNLGMSHDFDPKHGGSGGRCDGQGIMSYGDAPTKWSDCSVSDFTGYYEMANWGETCLKDWNAVACKDYCASPGTQCPLVGNGQRVTICDNPAMYGGCNGQYKTFFGDLCRVTCDVCPAAPSGPPPPNNPVPPMPTTTTTTTTAAPPPPPTDCKDEASYCANPELHGGCDGKYKRAFQTYCKKACGLCGGDIPIPPSCKDKGEYCASPFLGGCDGFFAAVYFDEYCKKTCGRC